MLVLSRRENESIVIDGRVTVRILAVQGGRVRLAIEAPREIAVRRSELPVEAPARPATQRAARPAQEAPEWRCDTPHIARAAEDQERRGLESVMSPTTSHTNTKAQPMIV